MYLVFAALCSFQHGFDGRIHNASGWYRGLDLVSQQASMWDCGHDRTRTKNHSGGKLICVYRDPRNDKLCRCMHVHTTTNG
jgi:hypothetical protein